MSDIKHTREPWGVFPSVSGWLIDSGDGFLATLEDGVLEKPKEANANRIATCVNACAGVPTPELSKVIDLASTLNNYEQLRDEVWRLRAQRDELATALNKAVNDYGRIGGPWNVPSEPGTWIAMARAALAKVTP